jgi:hypothetical protein
MHAPICAPLSKVTPLPICTPPTAPGHPRRAILVCHRGGKRGGVGGPGRRLQGPGRGRAAAGQGRPRRRGLLGDARRAGCGAGLALCCALGCAVCCALCCAILCCVALCWAVLCCTLLCCAILCCVVAVRAMHEGACACAGAVLSCADIMHIIGMFAFPSLCPSPPPPHPCTRFLPPHLSQPLVYRELVARNPVTNNLVWSKRVAANATVVVPVRGPGHKIVPPPPSTHAHRLEYSRVHRPPLPACALDGLLDCRCLLSIACVHACQCMHRLSTALSIACQCMHRLSTALSIARLLACLSMHAPPFYCALDCLLACQCMRGLSTAPPPGTLANVCAPSRCHRLLAFSPPCLAAVRVQGGSAPWSAGRAAVRSWAPLAPRT